MEGHYRSTGGIVQRTRNDGFGNLPVEIQGIAEGCWLHDGREARKILSLHQAYLARNRGHLWFDTCDGFRSW
jgi:hypothetical protein